MKREITNKEIHEEIQSTDEKADVNLGIKKGELGSDEKPFKTATQAANYFLKNIKGKDTDITESVPITSVDPRERTSGLLKHTVLLPAKSIERMVLEAVIKGVNIYGIRIYEIIARSMNEKISTIKNIERRALEMLKNKIAKYG